MTRTVRIVLLGIATRFFAANATEPIRNRLSVQSHDEEDAAALAHDDKVIRKTIIPPDSITNSYSKDKCVIYSHSYGLVKCSDWQMDGTCEMRGCPRSCCPARAPAPVPAPVTYCGTCGVVAFLAFALLLLCAGVLRAYVCGGEGEREVQEPAWERARRDVSVRGVEARHAEPYLQPGLPRAAPGQALCSRAQVDPLAPSAPLSPAPSVEEHRLEAESSKPDCVICMAAPAEFACLPCGHMCGCLSCLSKVRRCPICRQQVEKAVKVFLTTA